MPPAADLLRRLGVAACIALPSFAQEQPEPPVLRALCRRMGLDVSTEELLGLGDKLPLLLTPGAAEAIAVKAYRLARTQSLKALPALTSCLTGYQPPVSEDVLKFQMQLAIRETTDIDFVPESLRSLVTQEDGRALG